MYMSFRTSNKSLLKMFKSYKELREFEDKLRTVDKAGLAPKLPTISESVCKVCNLPGVRRVAEKVIRKKLEKYFEDFGGLPETVTQNPIVRDFFLDQLDDFTPRFTEDDDQVAFLHVAEGKKSVTISFVPYSTDNQVVSEIETAMKQPMEINQWYYVSIGGDGAEIRKAENAHGGKMSISRQLNIQVV